MKYTLTKISLKIKHFLSSFLFCADHSKMPLTTHDARTTNKDLAQAFYFLINFAITQLMRDLQIFVDSNTEIAEYMLRTLQHFQNNTPILTRDKLKMIHSHFIPQIRKNEHVNLQFCLDEFQQSLNRIMAWLQHQLVLRQALPATYFTPLDVQLTQITYQWNMRAMHSMKAIAKSMSILINNVSSAVQPPENALRDVLLYPELNGLAHVIIVSPIIPPTNDPPSPLQI